MTEGEFYVGFVHLWKAWHCRSARLLHVSTIGMENSFVKYVGGDGRRDTPDLAGGRTRPVPDYPIVGGIDIAPRRDGGTFTAAGQRTKRRERGCGTGFGRMFCVVLYHICRTAFRQKHVG